MPIKTKRQKNPEHYRRYDRWCRKKKREKNPEWWEKELTRWAGLNKKQNKVSPKLRFEILKRDNFTCQYCGSKAPETRLHIDHITPKSKGGTIKKENLITACELCNLGKYNF